MSLTTEEQAAIERLRSDGFTNIERQPWRRDLREAAKIALRDYPADDAEPVTSTWLLLVGFVLVGDHYECNLSADGFWKAIADLEEPPDLSIMHKRDWLSAVKANATRGDVRRLCRALGIELKG